MTKTTYIFTLLTMAALTSLTANETVSKPTTTDNFKPFTGKVTRNRVRLRAAANLDSHIIHQMNQGELFAVIDADDEFYAIAPTAGTKAYVFRTYVLDGAIEGEHVNVRLSPDLDAPVVAQLNTGDTVDGVICESATKWLEFDAPAAVKFYVAKDYVENAGPIELLAQLKTRGIDAEQLLAEGYLLSQSELQKPFDEMSLETMQRNFQTALSEYSDLSAVAEKAQAGMELAQDAYLEKKISFLESKASNSTSAAATRNEELDRAVQDYQNKLSELEEKYLPAAEANETEIAITHPSSFGSGVWSPIEVAQYRKWQRASGNGSIDEFYQEEELSAQALSGTLQQYDRSVKNKPGDYMLFSDKTGAPIAFLYSTKVNLSSSVGKRVSLRAAERPNNHFAFPAYHVLSVE
jgi:uncharacterized protein YgiM (DUF1202 family)